MPTVKDPFLTNAINYIANPPQQLGRSYNEMRRALIDYVWERMRVEKPSLKRDSVRRNIDRIIAYYTEKGTQSRSGLKYAEHIKQFFREINIAVQTSQASTNIAAEFLTYDEAMLYSGDITVLIPVPDPDTETIRVYRFQQSPAQP